MQLSAYQEDTNQECSPPAKNLTGGEHRTAFRGSNDPSRPLFPSKLPEVYGISIHSEDAWYTLAASAFGLVQGVGIRMWILHICMNPAPQLAKYAGQLALCP